MFENILREWLFNNTELTDYLALYENSPAVFPQKVPDDRNEGWNTVSQYGRVVYFVNMQADAERQISGTLEIDVHMLDDKPIESVAEIVKNIIDSHFFSSQKETIFAKWNATRYFDEPNGKSIIVAAVIFSLIAFPNQLTNEPDPIRLMNKWAKEIFPNVKLIGYDDLPDVWKVTEEIPAIYWRFAKSTPCERIPSTWAGDWYTAQMYAHIFTADISLSNEFAKYMCQELNSQKVLRFDDGTYMRVDNNNQVQPGADELRLGQLYAEGDYCVMRREPSAELLKHIYVND